MPGRSVPVPPTTDRQKRRSAPAYPSRSHKPQHPSLSRGPTHRSSSRPRGSSSGAARGATPNLPSRDAEIAIRSRRPAVTGADEDGGPARPAESLEYEAVSPVGPYCSLAPRRRTHAGAGACACDGSAAQRGGPRTVRRGSWRRLRAGACAHEFQRFVAVEGWSVDTLAGQGVIHVGHGGDTARYRDRLARQAVRVAGAVEALVVGERDLGSLVDD